MNQKNDTVDLEQIYELLRAIDAAIAVSKVDDPKSLDECDAVTRGRCYGIAIVITLLAKQDSSGEMLRRVNRVGVPNLDTTTRDRLREVAVVESCKVIESLDTSR